MTTIARQQVLDPVTLLVGNLVAWAPLAIAITFLTRAVDPLRSSVVYLSAGALVIVVLTLVAERPLLNRLRGRSDRIVEWTLIAASGAALALPGAVVFAVLGSTSDPSWIAIGASVGALVCGVCGVCVGLLGRALYGPLRYARLARGIILVAYAALLIAGMSIVTGVIR